MTHAQPTTDATGGTPVVGDDGLRGVTVAPPGDSTATAAAVEVALSDGRRVVVPVNLLQRRTDGTYYLPLGPDDVTAATASPSTLTGSTVAAVRPSVPPDGGTGLATEVIPLVAEQIEVHKRRVETGRVRVTKRVETHEEQVDVALQREDVTVERIPVERFVDEVPPVRHEGDVTIISLVEEVLVVEKRLMVREEIRLTTRRTETHDPRTVTLRKETAHVERVPAE